MVISEIILSNFKTFTAAETVIGMNAFPDLDHAEKNAVLLALQRIFGTFSEKNRIVANDFNAPGEMNITVKISFPEFSDPDFTAAPYTRILFKHIQAGTNGELFCLLSLSAKREANSPLIEQHLYWQFPDNLHIPLKSSEHALFTADFMSAVCSHIITSGKTGSNQL